MGVGVATAAAAVFSASATAAIIIRTILVNLLIGAITKATTKDPDNFKPPINVTVRNTIENRRIVFGKRRVGGAVLFYRSSGAQREFLHYVIALAGHQCNSIGGVWLDKLPINDSDIDPGTGAVIGGQFAGRVWIYKHLGTSAQTVDTVLQSARAEWDSTHRLQGICYIHIKMQRDDAVFVTGAPTDVSAIVEGALLYDPRLDSTNGGSGSHRRSDPSTWSYSKNPALVLRWFISGGSVINDTSVRMIRYGLREEDARIDDAYVIDAANKCESQITGIYATPDGAQQRYTCDLEVSTGETRREIIEAILACMAGKAPNIHGVWRIYSGGYDIPAHAISEADLFGDTPIEIEDGSSRPDRYNAVAAVFPDATASYEEQTTPFRTNTTYESQDGSERIPREIDLRGVTDRYRAQRLCQIEMHRSRMMRVVKLRGSLGLMKIAAHETFTLSHTRLGWTSRLFRCLQREFEFQEDQGIVSITAQQESSTVYEDMLTADYITPNEVIPITQIDAPDPPTNFSTIGQENAILVRWSRSATPGVTYVLEQASNSAMTGAVVVYDGADSQALIDQTGTSVFYFRIRAYKAGQYSIYVPITGGISGAALGVSTTFAATVDNGSQSSSSTSASQTTGTSTASPIGGTGPFSYAWTWASGGSGISFGSASSAGTNFTATSLGNPETRSGIARCTITDATAATAIVDVSVTIERTGSFAADATPSVRFKTANLGTITSNPFTCSAAGGTPPYTYAWSIVSHNDPNSTPVINTPTSSSTTVTTNDPPAAKRTISVIIQCVVTDATLAAVTSNTVNAQNSHDNGA